MSNTFWLLAANQSRARLFTGKGPQGSLEEMEILLNLTGDAAERDLVSDRPGRQADAGGHSSAHETHHKEDEADAFAARVSEFLKKAHDGNRFDRLSIVAAPAFLGLLRKHLPKSVSNTVLEEVSKDLVADSASTLQGHLTKLAR